MKSWAETKAGKMNPTELYPPKHWIRPSDILDHPFILLKANVGTSSQNGGECAYLTVMFPHPPADIVDSMGEKIYATGEYAISSQAGKIVGAISQMSPEDFPCKDVCFVAVQTGNSARKSYELWDYADVKAQQAVEQAEDSPFMEEEAEPQPRKSTQSQPPQRTR